MRLFLLYEELYEGVASRIERFKEACSALNVELVLMNSSESDYLSLPIPGKGDLIYNVADGSYELESLLLNNEVTSFYRTPPGVNNFRSTTDWTLIHTKAGIRQPKTIFHATSNRKLLDSYVQFLGGYPIIIKCYGGSRGIGVIKVDSSSGLYSTADTLCMLGKKFILREFIHSDSVSRLIVLGDEVISGWQSPFLPGDFRNSVADCFHKDGRKYIPTEFSQAIKQTALQAVKVANLEMAGVDIIADASGNHYLLEINFPAGLNFDPSGNNIARAMLQWLIDKANRRWA